MVKRQKGKKVYLLRPKERELLRKREAERTEKWMVNRLQERYLKLDEITKTFLEDIVLLTKNFRKLPVRSSSEKTKEIVEKEKQIKEQLLASFLESFYALKLKPETKKKAIQKVVDKCWKKVQRTEDHLTLPEKTREEIQSIKEKYVKSRHKKFVPFLIKMRILRDEHANTLFLIDKQKKLSAIDYCKEDNEWQRYPLGSCDATKEIFTAVQQFVDKLQKLRLINKVPSIKFDNKIDDAWDEYEFTFSPLGYLISLVGDERFEDTFAIKYALDLVIRDIYKKPEPTLLDKWLKERYKQPNKKHTSLKRLDLK